MVEKRKSHIIVVVALCECCLLRRARTFAARWRDVRDLSIRVQLRCSPTAMDYYVDRIELTHYLLAGSGMCYSVEMPAGIYSVRAVHCLLRID